MKHKKKTKITTSQTEMKLRSGVGLTRHLISGVLCLAVIRLICSSASAQNLFAVDPVGNYANIDEFTRNGRQSTFASGLSGPGGLAFDSAGNLFVADAFTSGVIYKFTPDGMRSTFALGLDYPGGLTFDSAGNLFVANAGSGAVYKFTPAGVRTTFASGLGYPYGLAFDSAGNLFVADGGYIFKFTQSGTRSTFASSFFSAFALAFDSAGNLFVADGGFAYDLIFGAAVYKFTPSGQRSTVASENDQVKVIPVGLAIDSADNLFVANGVSGSILRFTPSGVRRTFVSGFLPPNSGCCMLIYPMAFQPR
jgi:DNA-binding beta-propeller fold protein YncE